MMIFCGDTLFCGDIARTDFYGSNRRAEMAARIFDSIIEKILPLGDGVIVCPAHGAGSVCGGEIFDHPLTTIGYERLTNPVRPADANNSNQVPVWAQSARNLYYPMPAPNDPDTGTFYSGNATNLPSIGLLRDYYAWQWGDALFVVLDPYWYTKTKKLRLISLHPGVTTAEVKENSEFDIVLSANIGTSPEPAAQHLQILREEIDPAGVVLGK
jgi:hypothetical protein